MLQMESLVHNELMFVAGKLRTLHNLLHSTTKHRVARTHAVLIEINNIKYNVQISCLVCLVRVNE